ncbi:hypothetical protein BTJ40_07620 [Microbulbifer sp. A4B17]|uniref:hypothetical protein n=1 Tax=Microbulbifer sp. A4B17 TaxID=359370 RepID=UPI000D52BA7A|nr:hypothetical protein [Microbulbifer sp. A4B17]AWF80694.1 hypothetical protein BTJ40_07620 [Microbulbifer sp. A4B17]
MKKLIAVLIMNLGMSISSFAAVDAQMEGLYQKATKQGGDAVEESYEIFKLAQKEDPTDPVVLFYLGASETLMAKESLLPWRKVSYAENGIARMDKALTMIEEMEDPGRPSHGVPQDILLKGIAATTFTKVPKFFNAFDRGFELYRELMSDPRMGYLPPSATRWVYCGAVQAAGLQNNSKLANSWKAKARDNGISSPCRDDSNSD